MKIEKDKGIIVIDINFLPSEYKEKKLEDIRNELEGIYKTKILLIDCSRTNIQGVSNNSLPAYRI